MNVNPLVTNDSLIINGLKIEARIGTIPQERASPQILLISVQIYLPLHKAGKADNLALAVNYAEIINDITSLVRKGEFNLIEGVAEKVAEAILKIKQVESVSVIVKKKPLPNVHSVGASIWRQKSA
ncbi:MAG: dihydroneopterin aldolase [Elusimicrobia bacterium]|nr:dihydroneopterin aldolase [Candidatus Obscuribacterium magneticum]